VCLIHTLFFNFWECKPLIWTLANLVSSFTLPSTSQGVGRCKSPLLYCFNKFYRRGRVRRCWMELSLFLQLHCWLSTTRASDGPCFAEWISYSQKVTPSQQMVSCAHFVLRNKEVVQSVPRSVSQPSCSDNHDTTSTSALSFRRSILFAWPNSVRDAANVCFVKVHYPAILSIIRI